MNKYAKNTLFLLLLFCQHLAFSQSRPFTTSWSVNEGEDITIGLDRDFSYDFSYIWKVAGDTVVISGTHTSADGDFRTELPRTGNFTLEITGDFPHFSRHSVGRLLDVTQWGDIVWGSMANSFTAWNGTDFSATDVPDLSNVNDMSSMFDDALFFNGDLSGWDVSQVTNMFFMFYKAHNFNQDLSSWDVRKVGNMTNMLFRSGLSTQNYDQTLIGWAALDSLQTGVTLDASGLKTCSTEAKLARLVLINDFGWDIRDEGVCNEAADILSFEITDEQLGEAIIDSVNHTIAIKVFVSTDLGNLTPVFTLSAGATSNIASGVAQDFTNPVSYTITSEDGNTVKEWTVTVTQFDPFITSWSATGGEDITIGLNGDYNYDFSYIWKDAAGTVVTSGRHSSADGDFVTDFTETGNFTLEITGDFPHFQGYPKDQLLDVNQWGDIVWRSFVSSFSNWTGTGFSTTDVPDLSNVESMRFMFVYASAFNDDLSTWDVSQVTEMPGMFGFASSFEGDLSNWNVENVSNMRSMFVSATSFNSDLSGWDVTSLEAGKFDGANNMLDNSGLSQENYDKLLISWSEQNVQDGVFLGAAGITFSQGAASRNRLIDDFGWEIIDDGFTGDSGFITSWSGKAKNNIVIELNTNFDYDFTYVWTNPSGKVFSSGRYISDEQGHEFVTKMPGNNTFTLKIVGDFPQILNYPKDRLKDVHQWGQIKWLSFENSFRDWVGTGFSATDTPDLSNVESMRLMFGRARSFNGDLSAWDVSHVTDLAGMFYGASSFTGDLSQWNVSNVTTLQGTFNGSAFNGDLSNWNVSKVENMLNTFLNASQFNQDLSDWDVSQVTNMSGMFDKSALSPLNYDRILIAWAALEGLQTGVPLGASGIVFCRGDEAHAALTINLDWQIIDGGKNCSFTDFITTWDGAANQNILIELNHLYDYDFTYTWTDPEGTIFSEGRHTSADGDFVTIMPSNNTFTLKINGAFPYFQNYPEDRLLDVTQWGDIAWRTMYKSFYNWGGTGFSAEDVPDLSNVRSINRMFFSAHSFNGDLSNWDVSNVTDMRNTFTFTDNFNGDLSAWDVSNVLSMQGMFYWALSFNGDISAWDVSNVKNMSGMFRNTSAFNSDISAWDVSKVENMSRIFLDAAAFNSDISAWDVRKVTDMSHMFYASAFSPQNYDQILIGWAALDSLQTGVELGVGLTFCQGAEAREYLIDKFSWDIRDDGLSCSSEANARSLVLVDETSDTATEEESIDTDVLLTYPNPVQNVLYVKTEEHVQVSMTNISGKQVMPAQAGSQFELDMSQITMGVYLLIIQSGDSITTKRIIKNN